MKLDIRLAGDAGEQGLTCIYINTTVVVLIVSKYARLGGSSTRCRNPPSCAAYQ